MNRLWVRLSLAFASVVLVVMLIISVVVRLNNDLLASGDNVPPEVRAYFQEMRQGSPPLLEMTTALVLIGAVAIVAGTWMSLTLTAPLGELERARPEYIGPLKEQLGW